MIEYLVTWMAVTYILIGCDYGSLSSVDEYGIEHQSISVPAVACYRESESKQERLFDSLEEAKAFVEKAEVECGDIALGNCKDFKIMKLETIQ